LALATGCELFKKQAEPIEIIIGEDVPASPASPASPAPASPAPSTPPAPIKIEEAGFVYADPQFKMFIYINNGEWEYIKDRKLGQVYFYNQKALSDNKTIKADDGLISISAYEFTGDVSNELDLCREFMENNLAPNDPIYHDMKEIIVGESYIGHLYKYVVKLENDVALTCSYLFWCAGDMMYTCTTSADIDDLDEVQDVLDSIIKTFEIL
jgi:hypothetical protein